MKRTVFWGSTIWHTCTSATSDSSMTSGLILDTVVKGTRKEYELQVTQAYERYGRRRA